MRKLGALLLEIAFSRAEFAIEATWRFVEERTNGRPIDCQDYPKITKEKK
jgi:hypothetical protein